MDLGAHDRGNTHPGIVPPVIAILGAVALPRFWAVLPTWGRALSIAAIAALVVLGLVMLGRPGGMTSWKREPEDDGHDRRRRRDRADDAHRADGQRAVEGREADDAGEPGEDRPRDLFVRGNVAAGREHDDGDEHEPGRLRARRDDERGRAPRRQTGAEIGEAPREARGEREQDARQSGTGRVAATASSWFAW